MRALPLVFLLSGCVLRYGEPPSASPLDYAAPVDGSLDDDSVDFYDLERSLGQLIRENDVDIDTQKRLELAGELARRARAIDVGSQLVVSEYLRQLSALEARALQNQVTQLDSGFVGPAPGGIEIAGADPPQVGSADLLDSGEDLKTRTDYTGQSKRVRERKISLCRAMLLV